MMLRKNIYVPAAIAMTASAFAMLPAHASSAQDAIPPAAAQPSVDPQVPGAQVPGAQVPDAQVPDAQDRAAIRCSAAFALAAGAEARGEGLPAYAGLGARGREYLVRTGARLTANGWSRADVAAAMQQEAQAMAGSLPQLAPACRNLLDETVPHSRNPTAVQCIAALQLSAAAAAPDEAAALRRQAATLADRVRSEVDMTAEATGVAVAQAREAMLNGEGMLNGEAGGAGALDTTRCFEPGLELAKPD